MARLGFILLWALIMLTPTMAGGPWEGNWQVTWPNGGAFLQLEQNRTAVRGSYRNGSGRIEGTTTGNTLEGQIIHDGIREVFEITLNPDLDGFSGATGAGDWLSGIRWTRNDHPAKPFQLDLRSPRTTMRSFLDAGNLARAENPQALALAIDAIDFGSGDDWKTSNAKFSATKLLFELIDLATFRLATIPDETNQSLINLSLPRVDKPTSVNIAMQRGEDGKWRLAMPSAASLRSMALDLQVDAQATDAFRQLQSPRDTLRAFLDGMARWNQGGLAQVTSTLDLSGVSDVLKSEQTAITSQYLIRIIDRVGSTVLQSVPNSGNNREPFVYFEHPAGRIVIEPFGTGADTRWKFSAETVLDARRLFAAVQSLPDAHWLDPRLIPPSSTFAIRERLKTYAPALLNDVAGRGRIEYWQLLGGFLLVTAMAAMAMICQRMSKVLLLRPSLKRHITHPSRLALAIGIVIAISAGSQIALHLGLPVSTRQYSVPIIGSFMLLVLGYAGWQAISITSSILDDYAAKTKTQIDNILITFTAGVSRLALVVSVGLSFGHLWSLPTTGILAGLGISGLAVAFASKETLANVFGAGILLGDRPFRKGDRVIAGEVNGWVEAVGLRSTRIRTLYDSLLVVPNGKLADTTINNLEARRHRTLNATVLVTSGGTPEKLQNFTRSIAERISSDSIFEQHAEVNIIGIIASGIQIELLLDIKTQIGFEARAATHRLLIDIMRLAEAEGLTLGRGMEKNPVYYLQEP